MQNNEKQMRPDRTNDELKPTSSNILTDVERCRCDNLIHIKFKHKLLFLTQSYTNFTVHVMTSLLSSSKSAVLWRPDAFGYDAANALFINEQGYCR